MSTKPPGPPARRFENHMAHGFVEHVRGQIHRRCAEFPTHVYNPRNAELQLEECARAVIVDCLISEFPDWLTMPVVTRDWPKAHCLISADRSSARMLVSWSPETDAVRGGSPVDAIDFPIKQAPPSIGRRFFQSVLNAVQGKPVADRELAPIGKPTERQDRPRQGANSTAKPSAAVARAEQKPAPVQGAKTRPEPARKVTR